jgi:hypothetical protein
MTRRRVSLFAGLGLLVAGALMFVSVGVGAPQAAKTAEKEGSSVYVCACMKTKSCPCAAMANKAGKCPCGDDMKAVERNSKWAATNRKELAAK